MNIHVHTEALLGLRTPLSMNTFAGEQFDLSAQVKVLDFPALACRLTHHSPLPLCSPHFSNAIEGSSSHQWEKEVFGSHFYVLQR